MCHSARCFPHQLAHRKRTKQLSTSQKRSEKKINLDALNYALGVISEGKVQPIPLYLDLAWITLSCAAKEEHTRNAVEAVSLVLRALAPSQEENLWEAVTESRQLSTGCDAKEDVALESILLAYRECSNRATKHRSCL